MEINQPLTTVRRTVRDCARAMPLLLELLPGVTWETQVWIPGIGPVDFLVNGWLVLEPDGLQFHSNRAHYRRDRRRGNGLAEGSVVQLRFTCEDLMFHRRATLRQIARVLATRHGPRAAQRRT